MQSISSYLLVTFLAIICLTSIKQSNAAPIIDSTEIQSTSNRIFFRIIEKTPTVYTNIRNNRFLKEKIEHDSVN